MWVSSDSSTVSVSVSLISFENLERHFEYIKSLFEFRNYNKNSQLTYDSNFFLLFRFNLLKQKATIYIEE